MRLILGLTLELELVNLNFMGEGGQSTRKTARGRVCEGELGNPILCTGHSDELPSLILVFLRIIG